GRRAGRRVTLEYTLLAGVNDTRADADRLSGFARELPSKINLIPYNPVPGLAWQRPTPEAVQRFAEWLNPRAPAVTVRNTLGGESWAACGQLGGLSPAAWGGEQPPAKGGRSAPACCWRCPLSRSSRPPRSRWSPCPSSAS